MSDHVTPLPKPDRRGPKPPRPLRRYKRPHYFRVRGGVGKARKLADDLMSLYVRSRAGWRCESARTVHGGVLQNAHIQPKGDYPAGRYREDNAMCLCHSCHRYYTGRAYEWRLFVGGEKFDALGQEFSMVVRKWDYPTEAQRFAGMIVEALHTESFPRPELYPMIRERYALLQRDAAKLQIAIAGLA